MSLSLLKYARKATKSCGSYLSKRKSQRTRERKTGKVSRRKRLLSLMFTVLNALGLLILVLSAAGSRSGSTTGTSSAADIPALRQYTAIVDQGNRLSALQDSANSVLTAYPDDRSSALSSAAIDEKTGNQSYMQDAGNGGVAAPPDSATSCPDLGGIAGDLSKYGKITDNTPCSNDVKGDLLTGSGGWLYAIPVNLTTGNGAIDGVVTVLQALAEALLVLVIMTIGIRIMMGGGGGWSFGELLEILPRLIFSVIAVALCLVLAQELITCANAVTSLCQGAFSNTGISVQATDIIMPLDHWAKYLQILMYCGSAILIAMAIAPLSILGSNFGAWIAAGLIGSAVGLMITRASSFCILGFSMAIAALVIVRILLINVYVILSPLAVIAAGLPGQTGQGFTRQWIMGFLSLLAAQVAQVVTLGVGMVVLDGYEHIYNAASDDMGSLFIKYGILILLLRVPTLFSSNSTSIIKEVGPTLGMAMMRDRAPLAPGMGS